MDVFQYLHGDHSYIEPLDIQAQVIHSYRNPNPNNPNPDQHSPSSSSSQPGLHLEFLVDFTIHDSARLALPGIDHLPLLSQRLTTSNTLSIDPKLSSSWFCAHLELNRIGLETRFIEPVINVLQAKVYAIVSSFPTDRYGYGQASVMLQVNIKRLTMVPIPHAQWLTMVPIHHAQWLTAAPVVLGPLDYRGGDDDDLLNECGDEMVAIKTLEIVKAEDEEAFIKNASCAICLDDLQVVGMDEKKVKEVPMKLPCKHVFHEGCIRGWFKKSHFCPLCRSNVFTT